MNRYLWTRISTTVGEAQRIRRLTQCRRCEQESFGVIAEKETDLKMKRLFRPRWITIELLPIVKGMDVILHGLCPVPINRWTVPPYCSRWLGIRFLHHARTFIFRQTEGTFVICYCEYDNANKRELMIMFILFFVFCIWIFPHRLLCLWRFFFHNLHPKFIIPEGV